MQNVTELGSNIVSIPQLYGTTHTLFAHLLPSQGVTVRFAESDRPASIEKLIDEKTRAVFCESVGNPAGNICDIEELARVAHKHGVPLIVDNTVATPILLRPIEYRRRHCCAFADEVHGRARHHARRSHRRQRQFPLERARLAFPCLQPSQMRLTTAWSTPSISARALTLDAAAAFISVPPELSCRR